MKRLLLILAACLALPVWAGEAVPVGDDPAIEADRKSVV